MLVQLLKADKTEQDFIYRWKLTYRLNIVPFVAGTIALAPKVIPAWVGYAVTAGIAAISIGTSYLLKPNVPSSGAGAFDNPVIDPETFLPVIYGKAIMPFLPVFMDTHPENINLLMGIGGQCHGRINNLYKIYFGNMELVTKLVDDTYEVSEKFKGKVEFWQRKGGDTPKVYEEFTDIFRKWTSNHLGAGVASIAFRIHFDKDNITSIPSIQLVYKGKLLYDPRTKVTVSSITRSGNIATVITPSAHGLDVNDYVQIFDANQTDYNGISQVDTVLSTTSFTYTVLNTPITPATGTIYLGKVSYLTNPVLAVLDYLTNSKYGTSANLTTGIDVDSFIAEANYCDELIDYQIVDSPKKAPKIEIVERQENWLTSGSTYKYKYSYCYGSTIYDESTAYTRFESDLSPESNSMSVSSSYGKIKLTGILDSSESTVTLKKIYRQKDGTGSYFYVGVIDADETTFIDNIADVDVGEVHSTSVTPPTAPTGAITATFTNYANSALDDNRYYRYKFALVTSVTPRKETAPSPASKRLKTKSNNTAIRITEFPDSDDNQVTKIRIYRSEGFTSTTGTGLTYKHLVDVDVGTNSYVDLIADTSLDSSVTPLAASTTTSSQVKRFTCNGLLDTGEDISSNREKLLSACRGKLYKQAGKWKIFIPKIVVPETFELNENNIIGDWSFSLLGASSMPNTVKASFINPDTEWKNDTVIWPKIDEDNLYLKDDEGLKSNITLDLPFTNNKYIAKTICQVVRKESRNNIRVEVTVKEEAKKLTVGRVVKLTHSMPQWTEKKFWVEAVGLFPDATVRLILLEYTETDYNYESLTEDILPGSDTTFPDPLEPPDEVIITSLEEELFLDNSVPNWRIKGTFTNPADSSFWAYSDVYVKAGVDSEYELYCKIDKLSNGVFYIQPIEPLNKYYVKACSVSSTGAKQELDDATEYSITINPPTPDGVSDLEIENRGSADNVFGNSFKFRWSDKSYFASDGDSKNSYAHQQVSVVNENLKYLIEFYSSGIPSTVKISGLKVNERPLRTRLQKQNTFEYTVDNAIDDSREMFKAYENNKNHAYYKAYYGIPQREIKIVVKTLNGWSVLSSITVSKIVTNKAPDMLKRDGVTLIKPDVETILNGAEIKFSHPPDEYDINYFMLLVAGDATSGGRSASDIAQAFGATRHKTGTTYVAGANGNVIYPPDLNGHCYKCTTAGTTGSTAPTFTKPSIGTLHPTVTDGTVVWTHWCILRQKKISAQITVDSTEDEVDNASYEVEIKKLDRKKTYYAAVVPYDAYGVGTISDISSSFVPGASEDDSKTQIIEPVGADDIVILGEIIDDTNVKFSWTLDSSLDKDYYTFQWRAVKNNAATIQPTEAEANAGVTSGGFKVLKGKVTIDADEDTYTVKGLVGYKYFGRVRYVNRAKQSGEWSHTDDGSETWATHSATIVGSADDVPVKWAMYKFLGDITDVDATHVSVNIPGGTSGIGLKKKTNAGNDNVYIYDMSSTAFTGTKFISYTGGGSSAGSPATLSIVSEATMDANPTYVAIAKITEAVSGKCKVLKMLSSEHYSISAYEGGFNQLSAITADLGEITAGTVTGATIQTAASGSRVVLDSSGLRAYNGANQRVQISNDGSGWLGASDKLYWDTSGNLTVTGVTADSVAAEDIIAGTITGSTLQTASSGKRFVVSTSSNEAEFYGEESAGGTVVKLASIGISSPDAIIGLFGNSNATNTRIAVKALAYNQIAVNAVSYSGNAVHASSTTAAGIYAVSASGYGGIFDGNSTKSPLRLTPQSSTPSSTEQGQLYVNSGDSKLYFHNGTSWKEVAFV